MAVRMGKCMKGIIFIHTEFITGNKDCARGSQGNIAHTIPYRSGSHSSSSVIPCAGNHLYAFRKSQFFGHFRLQSTYHIGAFVNARQLLFAHPADFHHLFGPALMLHIEQQHAGCIGHIRTECAGQHISDIILGKHDFLYPGKIFRLIFLYPKNFRSRKTGKSNICRILR